MESFGEYLKRERELRNIDLEEVSIITKIKRSFLEALERDEFDKLPGETFVKGFIKAYASCIGLSGDEAILRYMEYKEKKLKEKEETVSQFRPKTSWGIKRVRLIIGILLLILLFLILGFISYTREHKHALPFKKEVPVKKERALIREPVKRAEEREYHIFIKAKEKTWLRVKIDNRPHFDIILKRGDTLLERAKKLYLIIGNAGGIDLFINGKFAGKLGESGEVVTISLPDKSS